MNTPLIVKFRNQLNAYRISELAALLLGFSGIIMVFVYYGLYRITQRYVSYNLPLNLLFIVVVIIWIISGVPSQIRIVNDRVWANFTSIMPVSPLDIIKLHVHASLLPTLMVAIGLPCMIGGAGIKMWTLNAVIRWLVVIMGLIWVLFLETAIVMTISRFNKGCILLFGIMACWGTILATRIGMSISDNGNFVLQIADILANDFGLTILGISGLVDTLSASDSTLMRIGLTALGHIIFGTAVFAYYSWRLAIRLPVERSGSPVSVVLSNPIRRIIKRIVPGPLGGQICVEWLRTLRSTCEMVMLYVLIILGTIIVDRMRAGGGDIGLFALVFGAMALASDTGIYVLDNQRGKILYDVYGINPRHYLLGFISSLGIVIASLCIVQIPIIGDLDWLSIVTIFSACAATSIILIDLGVVVGRRSRHLGLLSKIIVGLVCLFVTLFILGLSFYNFFIPLIVAGIYLLFEIRNAERDVVHNLYWDL